MRIGIVAACPFPAPQGSQALIADSARQLRAQGHELHVFAYGYGVGEGPEDVPIHRCLPAIRAGRMRAGPSVMKPLLDAALARLIRKRAGVLGLDVLYAHNYEGLIVALAARRGPVVYHAHNAMADELPYYFWNAGWAGRLGGWLDRRYPRRAAGIVAPHAALQAYLIECGCDPDRIAVIPPAADAGLLAAERTPMERPAVLYAGNADAYQNLPLLYAAMERVRAAQPEVRLLFAAPNRPRGVPDHVRWFPTPDAGALAAALGLDAVFACPRVSWSGYPIKLVNAMAAGCPIVCARPSAHGLEDGATARLAEPTPEAFAGALLELLGDEALRRRLGAAARTQSQTAHGQEVIGRALARVMKNARSET